MTMKIKEVGVFVCVCVGGGGEFLDEPIRRDHYKSEPIWIDC